VRLHARDREQERRMNRRVTALAVLIAALPAMALAQPPETTTNKRIDQRQQRPPQQQRPDRSAQPGQVKANEAARVQKGQPYVQRTQDKAMMTGRERPRPEQKQDVQRKRPPRQNPDGQTPR
jgi:hypothetical protein